MIDMDTVASEGSWEAALHAAGGAVGGGRPAARRRASGFAFCGLRPPGHHAERGQAMGFCLFNNVAVAAAHAIAERGVERVLVLDWDVHHGNGTEEIFYDSAAGPLREHPPEPALSRHRRGGATSARGDGRGLHGQPAGPARRAAPTSSCRWSSTWSSRSRASTSPGCSSISAGYDAHRDDPLAQCELDEAGYARDGGDDRASSARSSACRWSSASRAATRVGALAASVVGDDRGAARAGAAARRRPEPPSRTRRASRGTGPRWQR